MANNKYLDQRGVEYLWSKIKSFINTKTAGFVTDATLGSKLEYINYISNESVSSQSKSLSSSTHGETKSVSITNSGFEYGKAKRLSITVTAKVSGSHNELHEGQVPNKITVKVKLPSGGTWFICDEASTQILSGGSVVKSFTASAGDVGIGLTTTKTYTFYLAKVK